MADPATFYVYILRCADGSLYTGWTTDLDRRVAEHNAGRGAAYTRGRRPVALVYHEPQPDRASAMRREAEIKRRGRRYRERLVRQPGPTP
ncbi:MAG: GIY-YIG nuclease family protein [Caldilineales bacterium]|nr:GIY-YIG nuclease family protein [Caldilineales bacterium]MDW8316416.1 GIY-YIG nuclease family protein [Anaerolineae bacterium]